MSKVGIARSASVVGMATLLSRVLGLIRDMVILRMFGPFLTDAFYAAFRLPNTLRYLMGEGALSAAFIPVFSGYLKNKSRREAWELATAVFLCLLIVAGVVVGLGVIFAPWIVRVALAGFSADPEKFRLTVSLTRWLFPYLLFVSLVALCMGILNSLKHFAMPSLSQAAFNLTIILTAVFIAPRWSTSGEQQIFVIALGVMCGGAVQLGMQIPALRANGFSLVWGRVWGHPEIRRIIRLILPALAGLAVYHVNLLVDNLFASFLPQGSVTYLYAANRLIQFPIGTFAIGISTVVFPLMAGFAVSGDIEGLKEALNYALRIVLFITLPAGIGLMVLGIPIIRLLYERGAFLANNMTWPTYWAVLFYSIGVCAIGGVSVVVRCFYSLQDTRTPVKVACVAVAANIVMDYLLMKPLKHGGLALATSLASFLNISLLLLMLRKKIGSLGMRRVGRSSLKILAAIAAMAATAGLCYWLTVAHLGGPGTGDKIARVFIPLLAGIAVYFGVALLLGSPEPRELWHDLRGRPGDSSDRGPGGV
ncbi:MAG: murein biosynthesis integral membrane protein MurJ [Candidatus Aureabacteria bacterium]|nr:murein biosynthesis integral membrane protein MurJ [Candidatus Auribacterota bacterium]